MHLTVEAIDSFSSEDIKPIFFGKNKDRMIQTN
jgi:hypothetical protein